MRYHGTLRGTGGPPVRLRAVRRQARPPILRTLPRASAGRAGLGGGWQARSTEASDATGESDASPVSRHFRLRKCPPGLRFADCEEVTRHLREWHTLVTGAWNGRAKPLGPALWSASPGGRPPRTHGWPTPKSARNHVFCVISERRIGGVGQLSVGVPPPVRHVKKGGAARLTDLPTTAIGCVPYLARFVAETVSPPTPGGGETVGARLPQSHNQLRRTSEHSARQGAAAP